MSKSRPNGHDPEPNDDRGGKQRDVNLPLPQHFPAGVHRFRQLLAELIARRIRGERGQRPDSGDAGRS